MAAISTTALTFLRPGDLVVFSEPSYGGTEYLFHQILPQFDIQVECFRSSEGEAASGRFWRRGTTKTASA